MPFYNWTNLHDFVENWDIFDRINRINLLLSKDLKFF
jgi:hypothetical protein